MRKCAGSSARTRRPCALIFFATFIAYWPALAGGFLWDDPAHVTRPDLRSLAGLARIWFEPGATQQYYPLLHSAFWLEHALWGDATVGYHLVNVLLHATAACLFGVALRRLEVPGAWLAAAIFALHPVGVESVAWISEQKNTLSLVLYLGAALVYLRFDERRRRTDYAGATALFVAALLTKTVAATLPGALLVIFWWKRGRLDARRDGLPLLPWFGLGLVAGLFTATVEHALIGAEGADFALSFLQRGLLAGRAIWFYLGKLLWPADLVFIYPRWDIDAAAAWQYLFPLAALAATGGLAWWAPRSRAPLAALLFFGGSLFPALGFVNVFPFLYSFVADHFQYLASLGAIAAASSALTFLLARLPRWESRVAGATLLISLAALTWRQCGMYRDLFVLYDTTIAHNPACWMAHNNLAIALADAGRCGEAVAHFEQALRLRPAYPEAEANLGEALNRLGRSGEAIPHLERALQLQPTYADAHHNLGIALLATGRAAEGMAQFDVALRLRPAYPEAQFSLGHALAVAGRYADAIPHFAEAARLKPDYAAAQLDWGTALMVVDRFPEAVVHFEEAIRLNPALPEAHDNYGRGLARAGRMEEAIAQFRAALRLNPDFAEAQLHLALALRQAGGHAEEAAKHFAEAQRLDPTLAAGSR